MRAVLEDPGVVVERAALDVQVIEAHGEFVARADAPAVGGRDAELALFRAPVVGVVRHCVDAQGGVLAGVEVEVAGEAVQVAGADGVVHLVLVHQEGLLADLVDHAAGGALAEQHRGGALEHFHPVLVERVTLVQRAIPHAVAVDVAGLTQGEAAQAHVFLAGLPGLEGDACRAPEHLAEVVQVAVVDQPFRLHGQRLRDVAQGLPALADRGGGGAQRVLALRSLGRFANHHFAQRAAGVCSRRQWRLREAAAGRRQQQRAQGQQGSRCFIGSEDRAGRPKQFG